MKTAETLQSIITRLATIHGIDLSIPGAHMRLDMPHFDRLSIENIGGNQISVAHYFEMNGDLVQDPDVILFTGYSEWVPIAYQNQMAYQEWATVSSDGKSLDDIHLHGQAQLAAFCRIWARNIRDQKWAENAPLTTSSLPKQTNVGGCICVF